MILEQEPVVEAILPASIIRVSSEHEMAEYRCRFAQPVRDGARR